MLGGGLRRPRGRNGSVRQVACANADLRVLPNVNADRTCDLLSPAFGGMSSTRKARLRALGDIGSREVPVARQGIKSHARSICKLGDTVHVWWCGIQTTNESGLFDKRQCRLVVAH